MNCGGKEPTTGGKFDLCYSSAFGGQKLLSIWLCARNEFLGLEVGKLLSPA